MPQRELDVDLKSAKTSNRQITKSNKQQSFLDSMQHSTKNTHRGVELKTFIQL